MSVKVGRHQTTPQTLFIILRKPALGCFCLVPVDVAQNSSVSLTFSEAMLGRCQVGEPGGHPYEQSCHCGGWVGTFACH
jgi:hypothetical protein